MNKLWYIQETECYSALKRYELSRLEETWKKFKCILQREGSQLEKSECYTITTVWYSGKVKSMEAIKRSETVRVVVGEGWGTKEQKKYRVFLRQWDNSMWYCGYTSLCCCCCVASVVSDSVRPPRRQPTRLRRPWDSPGKNTGVGFRFLLQRMTVKSEKEVAQFHASL